MSASNGEKNIISIKIAAIKVHPLQGNLVDDTPIKYLHDLADRMKANRHEELVEVTPDGTVIGNYEMVLAAKLLGWEEMSVWVRDDLVALGEAAVEQRLIACLLSCPNLDMLDVARLYQRLEAVLARLPATAPREFPQGKLLDEIAALRGCSPRTLERNLRVLKAPEEVQRAYIEKKLSLENAGRVAALGAAIQQEIVAKIRAGEDPSDVVKPHLKALSLPRKAGRALEEFLRVFKRIQKELDGRVKEVGRVSSRDIETLRQGQAFLQQVLDHAEAVQRANVAS